MKSVEGILIQLTLFLLIVSCQNPEKENAEQAVKKYTGFVDSVHVLKLTDASDDWDAIQVQNNQKKINAKIALNKIADKEGIKIKMDHSILKFEKFKGKIMIHKEKRKIENQKKELP